MKRILSTTEGLLSLLALGAPAVVLALTFGGLRRAVQPASRAFQSPIETPTPPPYPPSATPIPTSPPTTPALTPTPIPRCTFAGQTVPVEPALSLEAYQFSEPQVVLTHTSAIGIAGWLPDGQRLLITRLIPGQSREYVEVFNTRTGELQRYGERHSLPGKPVWLAAHQAVAFADVSPDKQVVLRISRGKAESVQTPVSGLTSSLLEVSPDDGQLVFFTQASQNRPEVLDLAQLQRAILPAALPLTRWPPYRISWHPQGHQIAFYNETGFYLADLPSGRVCEVDLGFEESEARYGKRWALYAQWSPDGRYLAMLTTVGNLPVHFIDLTLIDTDSGEQRIWSSVSDPELSQHYIYDFAWSANSQHLITLAQTGIVRGRPIQKLYLVDVQTGDSQPVLTDYDFGGGAIEGWQLAWIPNGHIVAVKCPIWLETEPTISEDRICLIPATFKP